MPSSKRQSGAAALLSPTSGINNPTAAGLMDILRGGAQQSSSSSQSQSQSQQNPLMAAAQQFAAAAAAAQQFAAAAQMMAMVGNGESSVAAGNHHSAISSPPATPKRKKAKLKKVKAERNTTNGDTKGYATEDLGEDGKRAVANFWSSLGFRDETEREDQPQMALPREPEHGERKRPAAIQELLLMKKQRMNGNMQESDSTNLAKCEEPVEISTDVGALPAASSRRQLSPSKSPAVADNAASNHLSEIINQICSGHDQEDTETTTSSGSQNSNRSAAGDSDGRASKSGRSSTINGFSRRKAQRPVAIISTETEGKGLTDEDGNADYYLTDDDCLLGELSSPTTSPSATAASLTPKKRKKVVTKNEPSTPTSRTAQLDNDGVTVSPLAALVPHDQLFAQVPGRLSLLSNVVKYRMSVGEVKRRLMGPESFNFSLLGALLRRAKMPEKSQMLVDELAQVGLTIPRGRRRLSQVTLLSALTESESVQFAKDFQKITEAEFPSKRMAELVILREFGEAGCLDAHRLTERLEQLELTLHLAVSFVELLSQDRSPVMDSMPDAVFDQEVQDPLCTFSMLTHGFGTPALLVGMQTFLSFVKYQIQLLKDRRKQQLNSSHTA